MGSRLRFETLEPRRVLSAGPLAITELNYHPYDPSEEEAAAGYGDDDDFEFVELVNLGDEWIDLTGVAFTVGITFDFITEGSLTGLLPGEYVVLVRDFDAFSARYGVVDNVAGEYSGGLGNSGETITLVDVFGETIQEFTYDDFADAGWPERADGDGSSLEVIDPHGDYNDPDNWRPSNELFGSPGAAGEGPLRDIVINEVLSHTDYPLVDAIELHNTSAQDIEIGGWWLSDNSNDFLKFQIPADAVIPAGGYAAFYEGHYVGGILEFDQQTEFGGPSEKGFALDAHYGDEVWLLLDQGDGSPKRFADHVEFGPILNGESYGRWPDGQGELYPMITRTLGEPNSGPRIGPSAIISEVMYNPPDPGGGILPEDLEFVEIYNLTDQPLSLNHWRLLSGGADFAFPPETTLGSHEALVVVRFDPATDPIRLADFRNHYAIGSEVLIVGGYADPLSDTGERVQLLFWDDPPAEDLTYFPPSLEDEANYEDTWHPSTDGNGDSLNRLGTNVWGNDPDSWAPRAPSPGSVDLRAAMKGRYAFYNNSAWDDEALATDKTALLPGQAATFANYTSYVLGINGIMVDVARLDQPLTLTTDDFTFKAGNDNTPVDWDPAPTPAIEVRPGEGANSSDRIVLTWDNGAIVNQWLEVTVKANGNTGLEFDDVFYYGNAIGETGNLPDQAKVDSLDVLATRANPHPFFDPAEIDSPYDFNRDRRVNAIDTLIVRNHQTWTATELDLIDLSPAKAATAESAKVDRRIKPSRLHDSALRSMGQTWADNPSDDLRWLHEFEQPAAKVPAAQVPATQVPAAQVPATKSNTAARAVDKLLADK